MRCSAAIDEPSPLFRGGLQYWTRPVASWKSLEMDITFPKRLCFVGKTRPDGIFHEPEALALHAAAIAEALRLRGVSRGDRVALWLSSGADQVAAVLGCWMAGAAERGS